MVVVVVVVSFTIGVCDVFVLGCKVDGMGGHGVGVCWAGQGIGGGGAGWLAGPLGCGCG